MPAGARRNGSTRERPRDVGPCRVEYRLEAEAPVVLARLDHCFGHHAELAPYDAHLRLTGRVRGDVVLVAEATGEVVARRRLDRPTPSRPNPNNRPPDTGPSRNGASGSNIPRLPPSLRRKP